MVGDMSSSPGLLRYIKSKRRSIDVTVSSANNHRGSPPIVLGEFVKMNPCTILFATLLCCCVLYAQAATPGLPEEQGSLIATAEDDSLEHARPKRTLFLKKKLLGAGLLGFGLGVAKGYKAGYHHGPEVHHVYVAPPPPAVKYVEYVEKPVYVERIVERPVFKPSPEYEPSWSPSPPEPSREYGFPQYRNAAPGNLQPSRRWCETEEKAAGAMVTGRELLSCG